MSEADAWVLFLTSKVRLHCDARTCCVRDVAAAPFPDLKGQAPLRLGFLLVRPDAQMPFPDLKGQAPLRHASPSGATATDRPFPDLKGQAPLRRP